MDDFEAPSFSLGLDDDIHESPGSHAVLRASNPFRISTPDKNVVAKTVDNPTLNGKSNTDYDSDFESPTPSNTESIMKRVKRRSGQPTSASNPQQQVHHSNSIDKASQNSFKGSNEKKSSLPGKVPTRKTNEGKLQTLQTFWTGLNVRTTLSDSGCNNDNKSKAGCTGQGFGQATLPLDPLAPMSRGQTGASCVCEATTSNIKVDCSVRHCLTSKSGVCQGYSESPCVKEEGFPSQGYAQRPYGEKEGLLQQLGTCRGDTVQSFETCIDVGRDKELATRDTEQGIFKTLESLRNSLHNQSVGFHQGVADNGKGNVTQTFQNNLDENKTFLDDISFVNSNEKEGAPNQSSWKSSDAKTRNLTDNFSGRCGDQSLGKSTKSPKMTPKDQLIDLHPECPANGSPSKTTISTSQNKMNALHSFWRSLNEKKSNSCETNIGVKDDDIETCSSDDDFELGTQSARKLSLSGNASTRKHFGLGNLGADHISGRSLTEISANAKANKSSAHQYPPNKNVVDASPSLTFCSAAASPRTYQSFVVGDSLRGSPVSNLDKSQTKQSHIFEKLPEAPSKNIQWPCDDNDDAFFLPRDPNKDRAFNDCATPFHAFKANASPFGSNSSSLMDPILRKDSRLANFLRVRFPHFTSVSALRQGNSIGSEQIYIDYGNQFSGCKTASCQSGPRGFKQQARQPARKSSLESKQAAKKKQKIAMVDNDGWVQTGNRNSSRNCAMKSKKGHKGSRECRQTPVNTDIHFNVGAGHWVTERSGKRIYITKDGRKLSGSSAYKQHIKDSGKHFKKTKRRRPRNTK